MNSGQLQAFLDRAGIDRPPKGDLEFLAGLHESFLLRVPFENLEIHLGREIVLDVDRLFDKIVRQRRGGFCYEMNGLFHAALCAAGFPARMISARVWNGSRLGPDRDHMALIVEVEGERYLVDVGFGDHFRRPLRFEPDLEQEDPNGTYRIRQLEDDFYALEVKEKGTFKLSYRFDVRGLELEDFAEMCVYHQTSPDSHFTQKPLCSIAHPGGRDTLTRRRFLQTRGEERTESELVDFADLQRHLSLYFDVRLDFGPGEAERLEAAFF